MEKLTLLQPKEPLKNAPMNLVRKTLIWVKNNSHLVWPYDLGLLKILGIIFLIVVTGWQIERAFNRSATDLAQRNPLYFHLFSDRNAMIEFEHELGDYYAFPKVLKSFGSADVSQIRRFTKGEFEALVLETVPAELRGRLAHYLSFIVETAQKYQVDPFWLLAVMWTESHFNQLSMSPQSAVGLMQIVPQTGHFITQSLLKKEITYKDVKHYIKEPYVNIELGTIYLKRLLERFKNNYRLATVAYNLGPSRVLNSLNAGESVGFQNVYMNKVNRSYTRLVKFYKQALIFEDSPFENSYVFRERSLRRGDFFATMLPLDLKQTFLAKEDRRAFSRVSSWQLITLVD